MRAAILLTAAFLSIASPAQSCVAYRKFKIEDITTATIVFRGHVLDYKVRDDMRPPSIITFRVTEMIRGEAHDQLVATWTNSTFGRPLQWQGPRDLIVAPVPRRKVIDSIVYEVHQRRCSDPFLLPDTPQTLGEVRKLLEAP